MMLLLLLPMTMIRSFLPILLGVPCWLEGRREMAFPLYRELEGVRICLRLEMVVELERVISICLREMRQKRVRLEMVLELDWTAFGVWTWWRCGDLLFLIGNMIWRFVVFDQIQRYMRTIWMLYEWYVELNEVWQWIWRSVDDFHEARCPQESIF